MSDFDDTQCPEACLRTGMCVRACAPYPITPDEDDDE